VGGKQPHPNTVASAALFRRWLVGRLLDTQWAAAAATMDPEQLAELLWITPEAVLELKRRHAEQRAEHGRPPSRGRKRGEKGFPQLEMSFPEPIWQAWHDLCEQAHLTGGSAFRAVLHEYLLSADEPTFLDVRWRFKGKTYSSSRRSAGIVIDRPLITTGAKMALRRRADTLGVSMACVARGLLTDVLEGRRRITHGMEPKSLYDDSARYTGQ
jgi:hypothetical protein